MTDTEERLIRGCLAQDRAWQRQLFESYKNAMYTTVYRMLNDEDQAHDALQEGFIEVFRDLKRFRGQGSLGSWIKTIMVRKALRKIKIEQRYEPLDPEQACPDAISWPDPLSGEALDQAIRALSPGYRAVFTLVEVEGYRHQEVASMLGISEGTSKSQLNRAKKLLRFKLKGIYS